MHILFVDGNSPDGTGDIVRKLGEKYPFVHLLTEKEKAGLGAAYAYGFTHAMEEMGADAIVEMDADLQHDPAELPTFMKALDDGADYVIGSRFTKGGSIPEGWGFKRKLFSIGGNLVAKIVLGVRGVTDFTTGYKASRVKNFANKLDFSTLLSSGFSYKMDLLFRMHKLGAKIVEVPIQFAVRDFGESKMERNNLIDSLRVVFTLRIRDSQSFIKFCVVGFVGLFADTTTFNLIRLTLSSAVASLISGLVGMLTTFTLNNYWSFGDRKIEGAQKKAKSFVVYVVFSYVPILVRSKLIDLANMYYGDTALVSNIAFFVGIFFGLIWNFVVYSRLIWKKG